MKTLMTTGMFVLMCASLMLAACGGGDSGKPANAPTKGKGTDKAAALARLTVPEEIAEKRSPKPLDDPDFIAMGKDLYIKAGEANCASCHGAEGKADGILAAGFAKTGIPVSDLTSTEFHDAVTDQYIYWRIAEPDKSKADKSSGMLGYTTAGGDEEKLWAVVAYVRSLKGK